MPEVNGRQQEDHCEPGMAAIPGLMNIPPSSSNAVAMHRCGDNAERQDSEHP